jgi:hypothetical protein
MTKDELLDFVKGEFEKSGQEFEMSTAFEIFLTALQVYSQKGKPLEEYNTMEEWMKKIWAVYLESHEV